MCRSWLAIFVCLLAGCARPRLTERTGAEIEEIRSAPVVVAGAIWSDARAGLGHGLELRRVKVGIENVLKGDVPLGPAEIYYFTLPPDADEPQPLGMWHAGERRIFYLRPEVGVLHTACDGRDDCTIPYETGSHAGFRPDTHRPVDYAIAELLLTPGDGVTDEQFAHSIEQKVPARPINFVIDRLEQLASSSGEAVRAAACMQLRYLDRACAGR